MICGVGGISRLFWSWVGHSLSIRWALSAGTFIWAIGTIFLGINLNFAYIGLFLCSFGSACSSQNAIPYITDRWGQENAYTILSIQDMFITVGCLLFMWISGIIVSYFGSYAYVFIPMGILMLVINVYFTWEKNIQWMNPINSKKEIGV